jgi:lipopolysaccharide transport system ATP-binding protein
MNRPIIIADRLGKSYQLGARESHGGSFRDAITSAMKAPLRRLRQLNGRENPETEFRALDDVSFEVERGDVVGVIGRNGAGKSTLLKVLSQIVEPSRGRVELRGRVASLLEVGTGFHPDLSGRENVYLNGSILGMRKAEIDRKFDEIVAFAEVEKFLDTPVKRYSSGMYVRLAFAVAAHLEPEILIVDEVLAVGDSEFQKKCLGKMRHVAQGEGRTVMFVSHNMAAIRSLCQTAISLEQGRLVGHGPVADVVEQYSRRLRSSAPAARAEFDGHDSGREMALVSAWVTDASGQETSTVASGEPFQLHIRFMTRNELRSAELFAEIVDSFGQKITTLNTHVTSQYQVIPAGEWDWTCSISELWLTEGEYFITLATKNLRAVCDERHACLSFHVEGSLASNARHAVGRQFGVVAPPHSWRLSGAPPVVSFDDERGAVSSVTKGQG